MYNKISLVERRHFHRKFRNDDDDDDDIEFISTKIGS